MAGFRKASNKSRALKVLVYGATNTGKSLFGLTFPKIAACDSEDGLGFYENEPNLEMIMKSSSAKDIEEVLEELVEDCGDIKTLVIDSETKIYENLQHNALNIAERRAKSKGQRVDDANLSMREWGKIRLIARRLQALKIAIASQGINIISVCQEKDIKEKRGENFVVVGHEPDAAKSISFDYDIFLRMFTEKDLKTGEISYKAEVHKDRTRTFKMGDIITNPSFENWREVYEGSAKLEKEKINMTKDLKNDMGEFDPSAKLISVTLIEKYEKDEKVKKALNSIIKAKKMTNIDELVNSLSDSEIENLLSQIEQAK